MNYRNFRTGEDSPIPWDCEESKALGIARYMDERGCAKCGVRPVGRYLEGGVCVACTIAEGAEVWKLWKMGSPDKPSDFVTSREQAIENGFSSYYREVVCKGGPHFMQPHIKTGRCIVCERNKVKEKARGKGAKRKQEREDKHPSIMKSAPDMVITKEAAAALGFPVYRTGEPCRRGHTGWRYISNGACIPCMRGAKPPIGDIIDMNKLITISEQMQMFIGYAWDGRRMINPEGQRIGKDRFNCCFGSGRYQVSGGRPDVFTPHEAYLLNFGPLRV